MELREVPDRPRGQGRPPLGFHHLPRGHRHRGREALVTPGPRSEDRLKVVAAIDEKMIWGCNVTVYSDVERVYVCHA